jgi:hypothetical protein
MNGGQISCSLQVDGSILTFRFLSQTMCWIERLYVGDLFSNAKN